MTHTTHFIRDEADVLDHEISMIYQIHMPNLLPVALQGLLLSHIVQQCCSTESDFMLPQLNLHDSSELHEMAKNSA